MEKIGLTTTIPVEILFAANKIPVDLNNIFVTADNYAELIDFAEKEGFPKSMCAWIKGIYAACIKNNIKKVIGVVEGDCSNTKTLAEILEYKGIEVIPFSYPYDKNHQKLKNSIDSLIDYFGVSLENVEYFRTKLNKIRQKALFLTI